MTIGVALVASGVLGDLLVSIIERHPEFHVSAYAQDPISVLRGSENEEFHAIVLCSSTGAIPRGFARVMERETCSAVVAVSLDGKAVTIQQRNGVTRALSNPSPDGLLDAIRQAVTGEGCLDA